MKKYIAVLCLLPALCFGQGAHRISQVIVKGNGIAANVSPGSKILVCSPNTGCVTAANIYLDAALTTPAPNPVTANQAGNYDYYITSGCVDEQISSPGQGSQFIANVCPSNGQSGGGGGCAEGTCVVNNPVGTQTVSQPAGTGFNLIGSDSVSPLTVVMPTQIHGSLQQDSGNARFSNNVEIDGTLLVEQLATYNANITVNGYLFTTGNIGITDDYASLGDGNYSFGGLGDVNTRGALNAVGGLGAGQRTVTTSTQMDGTDYSVFANATSSAVTVTLPDATSFTAIPMPVDIEAFGITNGNFSVGRMFIVKKIDSSVNAVTVAATSGQTIDGRASVTLSSQYGFVIVQTNGANWNVIGANNGTSSGLFQNQLSTVPTQASTGLTTVWNTGASGTFTHSDTTVGITLADTVGSSTDSNEGVVMPYPATPFTATALMAGPLLSGNSKSYGFVVLASTTAAHQDFDVDFSTTWNAGSLWWSATNTLVSQSTAIPMSGATPYVWMRYKDDGTNITYSLSSDGQSWMPAFGPIAKTSAFLGTNGGFHFFGVGMNRNGVSQGMGVSVLSWKITTP